MNKLQKHYITLYDVLGPQSKEVTLSIIAEYLQCSIRHTKSLLKSMDQKEWISWKPGRGRGKSSHIVFQVTPEDIEKEKVQELIEKGDISEALKWMEKRTLTEPLTEWLKDQFHFTPANERYDGQEILSYPYYSRIKSLIPWEISSRHEGHLCEHIYNRLVVYNPEKMAFTPELLHNWEALENGRVWRLHIRKGVYFHDGVPFTSNTIVQHIDVWKQHLPKGWKRKVIESIADIQIHSPYTVDLVLDKPNSLLLHVFTDVGMMLVSLDAYSRDPDSFRSMPVGTGPYTVHFHENNRLTLVANNRFFGYRPQLDRVELYSIPNDHYEPIRQVDYKIVDKETKKIEHYDWYRPEIGGTFLVCNHRKPGIHTDPEFRRMVSKSLDRSELFGDHPYHSVWFPDSFFLNDPPALRQQPDFEAARAWVKEKGYEGSEITLTSTCLAHNAYFGYELPILQDHFQQLGLNLRTRIVDVNLLATEHELAKTDLVIAGFFLGEDKLVSMFSAFTSESSFIYNTLPDKARQHVDSQITAAYRSSSTEEAFHKLRQVENYLLDHYYVIFLYQRQTHIHIEADERLQGIDINRYNRLKYDRLWYRSGAGD